MAYNDWNPDCIVGYRQLSQFIPVDLKNGRFFYMCFETRSSQVIQQNRCPSPSETVMSYHSES